MNLQENIIRIKQVMGLNEQYPEGIDPKDLEALEVPIDNAEPEEIPNEEEPKDSDDFSNSVIPQIVWRAGRVGVSPKGGGIWFGETKKDVENFAWSVRDERREGLPYYINLQNPRYYKNFWNDYLIKAREAGRDVLMNALMDAGYDGIIIDTDTWNDTADEYAVTSKQFIVFDPKNVKPAWDIMTLRESIRKSLKEELSIKFKRRFPLDEFEDEFIESFNAFYNMMKKTKPEGLPRRRFLEDLIDGVITNFIIKMQLKSQKDVNEMIYDGLMPEMVKLLRPKIVKLYIERENI